MITRLPGIVRQRLAERRRFHGWRDWGLDLYGRVVYRLRRYPLPLRFKPTRIRLRGQPAPFYIRPGTTDWSVLQEIYVEQAYAPVLSADALLAAGAGPVRLVVDLGANVGFTVRLWLERFPEARVIAVEPDAANLAVAEQNAAAAGTSADGTTAADGPGTSGGPGGRVTWVRACAAGSARQVFLDRSGGAWGITMRDAAAGPAAAGDGPAATADPVPALPLEAILARGGPDAAAATTPIDLLKCDIEGAEQELFAGCGPWIGRVRWLVVEVHLPYDADALAADLRAAGARFDLRVIQSDPNHQVLLGRNLDAGVR
jgi:hypothetical protein